MKRFVVNPKEPIKASSFIKSSEIIPGYSEDDIMDLADACVLTVAEDRYEYDDIFTAKQAAAAALGILDDMSKAGQLDQLSPPLSSNFVFTDKIKKELFPYFVRKASEYNFGESRWDKDVSRYEDQEV